MTALERISRERLIAVIRRPLDMDEAIERIAANGVGVIEITLDTEEAFAAIERTRSRGDLTVLAGTVQSEADVDNAVAAGAEAIVCPNTNPDVIERARSLAVPVIPGALTPTEISYAWSLGASMVKLFPASLGGPGYLTTLRGPFQQIPFIATGGIDANNAADFLLAGAVAVGVGSALDDPHQGPRLVSAVRPQSRA